MLLVVDETTVVSHRVHFPPSFLHLSLLFLLFGSQRRFAVNNSWNRREIACTSTMGLVLREPPLHNHCCCCFFFFFPYTFYSTPIAPVCTTSRHRDPEPWGTQNATATSTHRRPITTTRGWVTLKEGERRKSQTRTLQSCSIVFVFCSKHGKVHFDIRLWKVSPDVSRLPSAILSRLFPFLSPCLTLLSSLYSLRPWQE